MAIFSMQTVSLPESRGKSMGYDYDMESMRNGHGQIMGYCIYLYDIPWE